MNTVQIPMCYAKALVVIVVMMAAWSDLFCDQPVDLPSPIRFCIKGGDSHVLATYEDVYLYDNAAKVYDLLAIPDSTDFWIRSIAISPSGRYVYVVAQMDDQLPLRYDVETRQWSTVVTDGAKYIEAVCASGDRLYAGHYYPGGGVTNYSGTYVSTDEGFSWSPVPIPDSMRTDDPLTVHYLSSAGDSVLIVTTSAGIYELYRDGRWRQVSDYHLGNAVAAGDYAYMFFENGYTRMSRWVLGTGHIVDDNVGVRWSMIREYNGDTALGLGSELPDTRQRLFLIVKGRIVDTLDIDHALLRDFLPYVGTVVIGGQRRVIVSGGGRNSMYTYSTSGFVEENLRLLPERAHISTVKGCATFALAKIGNHGWFRLYPDATYAVEERLDQSSYGYYTYDKNPDIVDVSTDSTVLRVTSVSIDTIANKVAMAPIKSVVYISDETIAIGSRTVSKYDVKNGALEAVGIDGWPLIDIRGHYREGKPYDFTNLLECRGQLFAIATESQYNSQDGLYHYKNDTWSRILLVDDTSAFGLTASALEDRIIVTGYDRRSTPFMVQYDIASGERRVLYPDHVAQPDPDVRDVNRESIAWSHGDSLWEARGDEDPGLTTGYGDIRHLTHIGKRRLLSTNRHPLILLGGVANVDGSEVEQSTAMFAVYPNPVHDEIQMKATTLKRLTSMDVLDALGNVVMTLPVYAYDVNENRSVSLSGLATGSYWLSCMFDNVRQTVPFTVVR